MNDGGTTTAVPFVDCVPRSILEKRVSEYYEQIRKLKREIRHLKEVQKKHLKRLESYDYLIKIIRENV
jgi:DNA-binding Lrp family transcriptional regulator